MDCAAWPHVRCDLASTRQGAAVFLENLDDVCDAAGRQNRVERWTAIGDAHCLLCDRYIKQEAFDEATEAWLCALTAFEVARRLLDVCDSQSEDISVKIETSIQRFGLCLKKIERVKIADCDRAEFHGYYLPAGSLDACTPAVICISSEQETEGTMLGRLLPVLFGRDVSVLVVSHDEIAHRSRGQLELLLSCCLDYLSVRPDVNPTRIGVYGDGWSAALATDFAASDRRVAAAVCDAGLWKRTRTLASIGWFTRTGGTVHEDVLSASHWRLARQLRCPVLVVAGGRGFVSVSEAIRLQAECEVAHIDLSVALPRMTRTSVDGVENFVSSDECIFAWLEHKLARALSSITIAN
ncbi:hypothetical protein ACVIM8_001768 [Bradyrhizobium sp. USDA 4529]